MKPKYEIGDLIVDYFNSSRNTDYYLIVTIKDDSYCYRKLQPSGAWTTEESLIEEFDYPTWRNVPYQKTKVFRPKEGQIV